MRLDETNLLVSINNKNRKKAMKTYELAIVSRLDEKVGRFNFLHSDLNIQMLKDLLYPLTYYKLDIREIEDKEYAFDLEKAIQWITTSKLTKTIAVNKTVVENKILGIFPEKPNIDIKIWEKKWHGISTGEYRSYIKNMSAKRWNIMFPTVETFHCECNKIWCEGKLTLELEDDNLYYLKIERKIQTVVYETITLEK